jgi:multiple sugar transport system substrate-binding protein/putative aldouronate transport system substrate-binding protein
MWDEMVTELKGFGFDDLYKFDVEKHTIEVNAKLAAMK